MEQNIGRDVSKYFYGGYSLENVDKVDSHVHSNDARRIVSEIVVGRLEKRADVKKMMINKIERTANESGSVKTVSFVAKEEKEGEEPKKVVEAHPCSLIDHNSIAKHYVVKTTANPHITSFASPVGQLDESK